MNIDVLIKLINMIADLQKQTKELETLVADLRSENFGVSYYNRCSPLLEAHLKKTGQPGTITWVNGWHWHDPNSNDHYTYHRDTWAAYADSLIDDPSPIIMLDVEGEVLRNMRDPNHPDRDKILEWYVDATKVYKERFPNKKIAWYAIPFISPWLWRGHPDDYQAWIDREEEICRVLSPFVDFLQPSIYDHYKDDAFNASGDRLWIDADLEKTSVEEMIRIALTYHKTVIPAIWRMYHNGNRLYGYTPIPLEEFTKHLKYAYNTVVNNNFIDGFMFWNRQRINWEDYGSGPRGMDPADVPDWLEESERESYNVIAKMAGLKPIQSTTPLTPAGPVILKPVEPTKTPTKKPGPSTPLQ